MPTPNLDNCKAQLAVFLKDAFRKRNDLQWMAQANNLEFPMEIEWDNPLNEVIPKFIHTLEMKGLIETKLIPLLESEFEGRNHQIRPIREAWAALRNIEAGIKTKLASDSTAVTVLPTRNPNRRRRPLIAVSLVSLAIIAAAIFWSSSIPPDNVHQLLAEADKAMTDIDLGAPRHPGQDIPVTKVIAAGQMITDKDDRHFGCHSRLLKALSMWRPLANSNESHPLIRMEVEATASDISQDGRWLVTGHVDGKIRLWNLMADQPTSEELNSPHEKSVTHLRLCVGGDNHPYRLLSASPGMTSPDMIIYVWDMTRPVPVPVLAEKTARRPSAITPDGNWLVTSDGSIQRLWDLRRSPPLKIEKNEMGFPTELSVHKWTVAFDATSSWSRLLLMEAPKPNHLNIDLARPEIYEKVQSETKSKAHFEISPDYTAVATVDANSVLHLTPLKDLSVRPSSRKELAWIRYSPDAAWIVGIDEGSLLVWNTNDKNLKPRHVVKGLSLTRVAMGSEDKNRFVVGFTTRSEVVVYDLADDLPFNRLILQLGNETPDHVVFSKGNRWIVQRFGGHSQGDGIIGGKVRLLNWRWRDLCEAASPIVQRNTNAQ